MGELRTGEVKAFTIKAGTELPVSNLGVFSTCSSARCFMLLEVREHFTGLGSSGFSERRILNKDYKRTPMSARGP